MKEIEIQKHYDEMVKQELLPETAIWHKKHRPYQNLCIQNPLYKKPNKHISGKPEPTDIAGDALLCGNSII